MNLIDSAIPIRFTWPIALGRSVTAILMANWLMFENRQSWSTPTVSLSGEAASRDHPHALVTRHYPYGCHREMCAKHGATDGPVMA
ncbi:MAG: hypothetical protein OXU53_09220 [Deltaproteobacteria bacterium]|nr:hypothetical protein [Deltaproteobacteria bacterium]